MGREAAAVEVELVEAAVARPALLPPRPPQTTPLLLSPKPAWAMMLLLLPNHPPKLSLLPIPNPTLFPHPHRLVGRLLPFGVLVLVLVVLAGSFPAQSDAPKSLAKTWPPKNLRNRRTRPLWMRASGALRGAAAVEVGARGAALTQASTA